MILKVPCIGLKGMVHILKFLCFNIDIKIHCKPAFAYVKIFAYVSLGFCIHFKKQFSNKITESKKTITLNLVSYLSVYEHSQTFSQQMFFFLSYFSGSFLFCFVLFMHLFKPSVQNYNQESTCSFYLVSHLTGFFVLFLL